MTVSGSNLTTGADTNGPASTTITTASITPTANALVILSLSDSVFMPDPTVSGNGLTWVELDTPGSGDARTLRLFRALGASPTAGAVTIDYGASAPNAICWSIDEFTGVDTSGTNGSGAVRQFTRNTGTGTAASVTLAAFDNANNGTYGTFANDQNTTVTPGTGFTELGDDNVASPPHTIETEWRNDNDTSVDATFAVTGDWRGGAFELVAASVLHLPPDHAHRPHHQPTLAH